MTEILIDTNILVYAYDENETKKRQIAKALLLECWKGKKKIAISTQNLAEFINVSKKIHLDKEEAILIVNEILGWPFWDVISYNKNTLKNAINNDLDIFDSLILEIAIENNLSIIYTENTKHFKTNKIKIINPF